MAVARLVGSVFLCVAVIVLIAVFGGDHLINMLAQNKTVTPTAESTRTVTRAPMATETMIPTGTQEASATLTPTGITTETPTDLTSTATTEKPSATSAEPANAKISSVDQMTQIYIPAGEFSMGHAGGNDNPLHTVYLDAFWFDETEVTNAQYAKCIEIENCTRP